ncbi:hypothetical protein BCR44DRAFT_1502157 [Catenaria anguillulae PL171]|uniref:Uncharacterized protein n=1 Tax=Catenaria anguillulae PL171 TaxID=765915 RepID=A0A1Y2HEB8_9FUNG|nr:hypothetical protein BCR44DRAFT_1502157 [Catenaria anguillulae PL171]
MSNGLNVPAPCTMLRIALAGPTTSPPSVDPPQPGARRDIVKLVLFETYHVPTHVVHRLLRIPRQPLATQRLCNAPPAAHSTTHLASSFQSSITPKFLAAKLGAAAHIWVPKSPQCIPAPPPPTEAVDKVRMAQDRNRMRRKQHAANAAASTCAPPSSSSATSGDPTPRSSARQSPSLSSTEIIPLLNFSFPSTSSNASTPSTTALAQDAGTD